MVTIQEISPSNNHTKFVFIEVKSTDINVILEDIIINTAPSLLE